MDVRKIIIMFILYSIIGWIGEMIYCYIYDRSFVNRGFLNGPVYHFSYPTYNTI